MRVRISYSVELEEVPAQSSRLLEEALDGVHRIMVNIQNIQDGKIPNEFLITQLEKIRLDLTRVDYNVTDAGMIMKGYMDTSNQINNQLEKPSNIDEAFEEIEKEREDANDEG